MLEVQVASKLSCANAAAMRSLPAIDKVGRVESAYRGSERRGVLREGGCQLDSLFLTSPVPAREGADNPTLSSIICRYSECATRQNTAELGVSGGA